MTDINANSHAGNHEDQHGEFRVLWANNAWWYIDDCQIMNDEVDIDLAEGPYSTSEEAYDAATKYGC